MHVSVYVAKWRGVPGGKPAPIPSALALFVSVLGAFVFIGVISLLRFGTQSDYVLTLGSFGATAVLLFGAPMAPLSQPRNAIFGQLIACIVGVAARVLIAEPMQTDVLALPLASALCLGLMLLTSTTHPPAGGTLLIAILGGDAIKSLGFALIVPVAAFSVISVLIAVLINNLSPDVHYPQYWFVASRPRQKEPSAGSESSVRGGQRVSVVDAGVARSFAPTSGPAADSESASASDPLAKTGGPPEDGSGRDAAGDEMPAAEVSEVATV